MPLPRRDRLDRRAPRTAPSAAAVWRRHRFLIRKASFAPVVSPDTRILILGSLPGEASLAAGRYYAHPQNQFWRLIGEVTQRNIASLDYEARISALLAAKIGLWDTVASAQREGSLDGALREVERADLPELVATLPALRTIAFNGATAAKIGRKALCNTTLALIDLPSSSPAHAAMTFAQKAERWKYLREFLR
jgi:double-stranded uracil-DNA glycosylase